MKKEKVPQDNNETYQGYSTKVVYAVDEGGNYTQVKTSGWEVEEIVLQDVVNDFKDKAQEVARQVMAGQASPIEYFMHAKYMDLPSLAAGVGMAKWRVKRHLTAKGFKKLNRKKLQRYADFFNIEIEELSNFNGNPPPGLGPKTSG